MIGRSDAREPAKLSLFTIGYEGKTLEAFVNALLANAVSVLVDVRELPLSRKRGFSKTALSEQLAAAGIDYVHFASLGSPKDVRHKLLADGDYEAFFKAYAAHLGRQDEAVAEVRRLLGRTTVCLMCYEADAEKCHRSLLAAELEGSADRLLEVIHR